MDNDTNIRQQVKFFSFIGCDITYKGLEIPYLCEMMNLKTILKKIFNGENLKLSNHEEVLHHFCM